MRGNDLVLYTAVTSGSRLEYLRQCCTRTSESVVVRERVRVRVWTVGCGARSMLDLCAIVLMGQVDCYVGGHAAMISDDSHD
jgi:hypothetical protein